MGSPMLPMTTVELCSIRWCEGGRINSYSNFADPPRNGMLARSSGRRQSIGKRIRPKQADGAQQDDNVKAYRPVFEVLQIELDPALHVREAIAAPGAIDLCPTGNPRPHLVAQHVSGDQPSVGLVHCDDVRTRSDETHGAADDIEKLRQLIERGLANEGAERGNTVITALNGEKRRGPIFAEAP